MTNIKSVSNYLTFGLGKAAAFRIDEKKDHTSVKPKETNSQSKIAKWGDDNRYPQNFLKMVRKNGAAGASYRFLKATHYGQGFKLHEVDATDDGKEQKKVVPLASQKEINEFFKRSKMQRVWLEIIHDLETFTLAFPEFTITNDYSEIYTVRRQPTAKWRFEKMNPKTGLIEHAYFCHNWQANTNPEDKEYVKKVAVVDSYLSAAEIKEYCKAKKIHKFVMPIFYPLMDEIYYPEPDHHSPYRNGWMEVVNNIPAYKKAFSKNQLNIKHMVYISEEYFTRTYGQDWDKFTTDKKQEIRQHLSDSIDDHLSGNENAGKSIQSTVFKDREGKWVKGIEVVPLKNEGNDGDGKGLLDAGTGNQEIMNAIGTDPNLMGTGIPGSKLGGEGGSNKREAFSILNSLFKSKREITLDIWRLIRDYNGWNQNLEGDFAVNNLTTLDKNPTGTQNEL
ncbi:hypothetical protein [Mesonia sp. HuA40]|uniref:hypothetical protein n=1 Tax=Mesonia sp. HuA40 TaxID=2602761 RepID=UPI0011C97D62|nr:hypothetical protein [Mesonia sp. HuA40]TXK73950.1 hypothetical protein FT993_03570 [Mesonia sp. HuA40]